MGRLINKAHRRGLVVVITVMLACLFLAGCGNNGVSFGISVHMPGGNETVTRFADEEIMARSNTITITAGSGVPDGGISLVGTDGDASSEMKYIYSGATVEFNVKKGNWYKIRIQAAGKKNGEEYDYVINVDNVDLRVSSKAD